MASDNFVQLAIPHFDGYYDHWSMLIVNFLRLKEYWQIISQGIIEPPSGSTISNAQWLKDFKVKNYFLQSIDRSILKIILCKETSKDIRDLMRKKYQKTTRANRQQL